MDEREVNEGTTTHVYAKLIDGDGSLIRGASITGLKLWLYDSLTGAIVNSRGVMPVLVGAGQDVLNDNDVEVFDTLQTSEEYVRGQLESFTYNLHWEVQALDNQVLDKSRKMEAHLAVFQVLYGTPSKSVTKAIRLIVKNLNPLV